MVKFLLRLIFKTFVFVKISLMVSADGLRLESVCLAWQSQDVASHISTSQLCPTWQDDGAATASISSKPAKGTRHQSHFARDFKHVCLWKTRFFERGKHTENVSKLHKTVVSNDDLSISVHEFLLEIGQVDKWCWGWPRKVSGLEYVFEQPK